VGAAAGDNLAAILRGHAMPEAMAALADDFAWLICALHVNSPSGRISPKEPCF
jgi:hypothetical protein